MGKKINRCIAWFCDPLCCVFDLRRPFSCPHDRCYTIMAIVLAVSSWASGIMMIRSCYFERIQQMDQETGQPIPNTMRGYGFFSRQVEPSQQPDYQDCIAYTDIELAKTFNDSMWRMGQAASVMSLIFGGIGMVIVLSTCCLAYHLHMFEKLLLWIYILAAIAQAFSFMAYGTSFCKENECRIGQGAGLAITNFMMWLTCANTVKSFPEALPPERYHDDDDDYSSDEDDWYDEDEEEEEEKEPEDKKKKKKKDKKRDDAAQGDEYSGENPNVFHGEGEMA